MGARLFASIEPHFAHLLHLAAKAQPLTFELGRAGKKMAKVDLRLEAQSELAHRLLSTGQTLA